MTALLTMVGELAKLAQSQAEKKARRATLKIAGGAVAGLFLTIAVGFAFFGAFLRISAESGPVTAAFVLALFALFLALLVLALVSMRGGKSHQPTHDLPPELARQIEKIGAEAAEEIGKAAPYIVAAGFAAGFLSGRK